MSQYKAGIRGEAKAEAYLCEKGMTLLERRYRGQDGEIDLIMRDGDMIVFVEVKARPGGAVGSGFAAVTPAKQRRIAHAAMDYLIRREFWGCAVRFDVVEISESGIMHIPNAFMDVM